MTVKENQLIKQKKHFIIFSFSSLFYVHVIANGFQHHKNIIK